MRLKTIGIGAVLIAGTFLAGCSSSDKDVDVNIENTSVQEEAAAEKTLSKQDKEEAAGALSVFLNATGKSVRNIDEYIENTYEDAEVFEAIDVDDDVSKEDILNTVRKGNIVELESIDVDSISDDKLYEYLKIIDSDVSLQGVHDPNITYSLSEGFVFEEGSLKELKNGNVAYVPDSEREFLNWYNIDSVQDIDDRTLEVPGMYILKPTEDGWKITDYTLDWNTEVKQLS